MGKREMEEAIYINDLKTIKGIINKNQSKAINALNSAMIMTYYEIGVIINKRKSWGDSFIAQLASDLKEYGNGYSKRHLFFMGRLAHCFNYQEISSLPIAYIPWSTLVTVIMPKSSSHEEMIWYIKETYKNGWSRSMLMNQMEMKAYERSLISPSTTEVTKLNDLTNELFKDTYVFRFLDREKIKTERDLKNQLVDNIIKFLQELGPGFSLVGREYKIETPTGRDFYIDLLMYHTKIHAYVVIEVKLGEFVPQDLGQLIFYVNAVEDLERTPIDEETIGLLLCKEADAYVAKASLSKSLMKLGISKYKLIEDLPTYLEKRLNENK